MATDNPFNGPVDGRTVLPATHYFFLGNGYIEAALQVSLSDAATAVGLALMRPEVFGRKADALSFHPQRGLADSLLEIRVDGHPLPIDRTTLSSEWTTVEDVPAVAIRWQGGPLQVEELFFCPDRSTARLIRRIEIEVVNSRSDTFSLQLATGLPEQQIEQSCLLSQGARLATAILYELQSKDGSWKPGLCFADADPDEAARKYWRHSTKISGGDNSYASMYLAARNQIQAVIAHSGRTDASIWQYNLEWVRDQSMMAVGLTLSGQFENAALLLDRMLREFVSPAGDTIDSGRHRSPEEIELDQNGELLYALFMYCRWSGDLDLARRHWPKVRLTAELPLQPVFRHAASGLLHNKREYWERSAYHGVEDGLELMYQFYPAVGLDCAATLAEALGYAADARRWRDEAQKLKNGLLGHPQYRLIANGALIKRRRLNGSLQEELRPAPHPKIPAGVPLSAAERHWLNPDASTALPIAMEFIDPGGELARSTLEQLESLWNQRWQGGGYGRYHVSSEPDSPGPWPFASLFVARAYLEAGQTAQTERILAWLKSLPGAASGTWHEFYGPRPIPPCPQIGFVGWTWAEVIILFVHHILGLRPEADGLRIRPRLLPGLPEIQAQVRYRRQRIQLLCRQAVRGEECEFRIGDVPQPYDPKGILLTSIKDGEQISIVLPAE